MRLRNVTFANWLRSHGHKDPKERWLRELYPWPVLAQVDCDENNVGRSQRILHDGVEFDVVLKGVRYQETHGTFKYHLLVESEGLGWHSRSFADEFDMCGTPDGTFVTVFHRKKEEPLEKIARAFFQRRWKDLGRNTFKNLAVSRFLAASIAGQIAEEVLHSSPLQHYPNARLLGGPAPMLASGADLWIGYRFWSEGAHEWARRSAGNATKVVALYFADTKHQFRTTLPGGAIVRSLTELDSVNLGGKYADFIRILLRGLELPTSSPQPDQLAAIISGTVAAPVCSLSEADVTESLAALKRGCNDKAELRYQLAASVVLNTWIESERRLGFVQRRNFYAFKQRVDSLANWALMAAPKGVAVWAEEAPSSRETPLLYVRVDDVDFSFHAIPLAKQLLDRASHPRLEWRGVRLKPIAPLVLAWARSLLSSSDVEANRGGSVIRL